MYKNVNILYTYLKHVYLVSIAKRVHYSSFYIYKIKPTLKRGLSKSYNKLRLVSQPQNTIITILSDREYIASVKEKQKK